MHAGNRLPETAALIIIDVQTAIDDPVWQRHGPRNNPEAEQIMEMVLTRWRKTGRPVFHVRHESQEALSAYHNSPFKACVQPIDGETVLTKQVNIAFIGTQLEAMLQAAGITHIVIFGVITNNSVEATVRMAGNLGFRTYLIEDACFTFARPDYSGVLRSAEEVHAMSLANLAGEYSVILTAAQLVARL